MNATAPWIDLPPAPDSSPLERLAYRRAISSLDMIRDLALPMPDFDRLRAWHRHQIEMTADRIVQRIDADTVIDAEPTTPTQRRLLLWPVAIGVFLVVTYMVIAGLASHAAR